MVTYLAGNRAVGTNAERLALPSGLNTYNFTGSDQTFIVPSGNTSLTVKMWGAGGGGSGGSGGAGGYVGATLGVTAGQVLKIVIPKGGGKVDSVSNLGSSYAGSGRNVMYNNSTNFGAGYCGIFLNSVSFANAVLVAGGGGSGGNVNAGGNGGSTTGDSVPSWNSCIGAVTGGGGGTQSAGGSGQTAGGQLQGGDAGNTSNYPTAAGGSGYYGGGSGYGSNGNCGGNAGGGGSSYVGGISGITVSNITNTKSSYSVSATSVNPPNTSDSSYITGVGVGRNQSLNNGVGGDGLIVISYSSAGIQNGLEFHETDTNKDYVFNSSNNTWYQIA